MLLAGYECSKQLVGAEQSDTVGQRKMDTNGNRIIRSHWQNDQTDIYNSYELVISPMST